MIFLSPERMKKYDEYAINTWGIPSSVLMENAGRSTYRLMKESYLTQARTVTVCCGRGNNGGDGFVIARYLLRDGFNTCVFLTGDLPGVKGDAKTNLDLFVSMGGKLVLVTECTDDIERRLRDSDIIVDALFGTGLSKEVAGVEKTLIECMNDSGKPIIAVDIPSGLDGKTGAVLGCAVKAVHTYTYGYPKTGLLLHPGMSLRGALTVIDICLPLSAQMDVGIDGHVADGEVMRQILRPRPIQAHKGSFGHVGVIAGSAGKTGASVMTAHCALKIGAGLVTLATPCAMNPIVATKLTEVMTYPVGNRDSVYFADGDLNQLKDFSRDKDIVIIGPGLGQQSETSSLVRQLLSEIDKPFVIDADGINALAGHLDVLKSRTAPTILTPHPGEFGRLIGRKPQEVNAERMDVGKAFMIEHQVSLVLKGAPTVFFSAGGGVFVNPTGNPALAKGGTGDVLTGFIGGLAGQGYTMEEAAILGVYLHGYVADTWAENRTDMDLLAGDLIDGLGEAIRDIKNGTDRIYISQSL
jgi:ADP-dependent NAD(P)H-hydrate dehydratase / NAD(P)H-hydrate epimerase